MLSSTLQLHVVSVRCLMIQDLDPPCSHRARAPVPLLTFDPSILQCFGASLLQFIVNVVVGDLHRRGLLFRDTSSQADSPRPIHPSTPSLTAVVSAFCKSPLNSPRSGRLHVARACRSRVAPFHWLGSQEAATWTFEDTFKPDTHQTPRYRQRAPANVPCSSA